MSSEFMKAVGAYMFLASGGSGYMAAGVSVGGTTLRASSLRLEAGQAMRLPEATRLGIAADRIGIGQNSQILQRLAPFLLELDIGGIFAGNASTAMQGERLAGRADAVSIGATPRRDGFWPVPAESALPMARAYAKGGGSVGNAYNPRGVDIDLGEARSAFALSLAGVRHVQTGAGADTISANGAGHVDAGDGDNMLALQNAGHVRTGSGNDRIVATLTGHVDAGSGENMVVATETGHINAGDGDDRITANGTGHIHAGGGRNVIDATGVGHIEAFGGDDVVNATGAGQLLVGDGRNVVTVARAVAVYAGKDADRISASSVGRVDAGDGDNVMALADVGWMSSGSGRDVVAIAGANWMDTGGGDDTIDATNVQRVTAGAGNDTIKASNVGRVMADDGDDTIVATNVGRVTAGTGNDLLTLARATAVYRRGDGNDTILAGHSAAISFEGIRQSDANISVERDKQGRVMAIDIALADGTGGVKIFAGPNGVGDATIRFADGTSVPYALVANAAPRAVSSTGP